MGNGQAAVEAVLELRPDLIVRDILMPVLDFIQVVRQLRAAGSSYRVLMLTGLEGQDFVFAALEAGTNGFVFKIECAPTCCMQSRKFWRGTLLSLLPLHATMNDSRKRRSVG